MSIRKQLILFTSLLLASCGPTGRPPVPSVPDPTPKTTATIAVQTPPPLPPPAGDALKPSIALMQSVRQAQMFRIGSERGDEHSKGILGYPILARPVELSEAETSRVKDLIQDPRGYIGATVCGMQPGIAIRFSSGEHVFTVLVCFKCTEWEFWRDNERIGEDCFRGLQPELIEIVHRAFPGDPALREIQSVDAYARVYQVAELAPGSAATNDQRAEIIDRWQLKVMNAIGEMDQWSINGGGRYFYIPTADNRGFVLLTSARGHRVVEGLPGVRIWKSSERPK